MSLKYSRDVCGADYGWGWQIAISILSRLQWPISNVCFSSLNAQVGDWPEYEIESGSIKGDGLYKRDFLIARTPTGGSPECLPTHRGNLLTDRKTWLTPRPPEVSSPVIWRFSVFQAAAGIDGPSPNGATPQNQMISTALRLGNSG